MVEIEPITKKDLKVFREEFLTHMLETFNILVNNDLLDYFLSILNDNEREQLYSHPLLKYYDLLP
ncbi:MAG: hypothetical protein ACTSQJ_00210 [Promethearchaeota archaeon]